MKIRSANLDDVSRIKRITANAYQHYIARLGKPPGPMLDDYTDIVTQHLTYVAVEQDILGFVVLMETYQPILLDNIAVDPAQQAAGIGSKLLAFAEQVARDKGHSSIQLYTNELMHENIEYYSRKGYHITAKIYEKGYNRIYMTKRLIK